MVSCTLSACVSPARDSNFNFNSVKTHYLTHVPVCKIMLVFNVNVRSADTGRTMAVVKVSESVAWEKGAVVLRGVALHALVMANGLLDGRVFISQPVPLFHTTVQTWVHL